MDSHVRSLLLEYLYLSELIGLCESNALGITNEVIEYALVLGIEPVSMP
jgi:hypothetical protein